MIKNSMWIVFDNYHFRPNCLILGWDNPQKKLKINKTIKSLWDKESMGWTIFNLKGNFYENKKIVFFN